jgi:SNF family Na+-dependent transporter
MQRSLISDALAVLREAVGMRRYSIGNLVKGVLAFVGLLVVSITGYVMNPIDTAAVGLIAALAFLCFCLWQYSIMLYRERISQY